ncbi:PREDICTED: uncharacterized protein LOC109358055 [Lupinus angustifolius]|uniref:uncharacterized protein LOC109358055 n=1 Tax=Lupinus angustifolius TaxID=3871 RepID=UPI00092F0ABD|nr:PREDICTED: uncharacterized protein LOC109358055 [Lupinus angustifolius]
MAKLLWNLASKPDKLWVRWIHTYYIKGTSNDEYQPSVNDSWILKAIMKCRTLPKQYWTQSAFSTKSIYMELRGQKQRVPWSKLFYDNLVRPRAQFTLRLGCQQRLPTKTRLRKFRIHTDGKCIFCDHEETTDHLFFLCPVSSTIWTYILKWLKQNHTPRSWVEEMTWIICETKGKSNKSRMLKCAITETMYEIWNLRNLCIF